MAQTPVLVRLTGLAGNSHSSPPEQSEQAALELKAWTSSESSDKVVWELRRLYAVLSPERRKLDLKKVLNRYKSEWSVIWQSYGVSESEALYLNRASLISQGKSPTPDTHEEHGISTVAWLAIVADQALYRRKCKDRQHCQAFLNSWVAALLPHMQLLEDAELEGLLAATRGCRNELRCSCMESFKADVGSCKSWGWCLVTSKKTGLNCSAVNVVHIRMLRKLAEQLANAASALPPADMST